MKAYFIFFSYNRALPRPIAVFFDKNKAFKHIHQFGEEHVELRMCDWKEGVFPRWVDCTAVEIPAKKVKKNESNTGVLTT
jgi:hypothetical protein